MVANGKCRRKRPAAHPCGGHPGRWGGCHHLGQPLLWKDTDCGFFGGKSLHSSPCQFYGRAPGRGWAVYDCGRVQVGVMNLIGRCNLDFNAENPFTTADRILKSGDKPTFTLVDFHAPGHQRKAGPVVLFGWPGQRPVGYPYPRTHRRWASLPQGHGLSHRPGYDRAGGVCAGRPAGAIGGVFSGGAAGPISDGGTAPAGCREPCLHWIAAPACAPGWSV